MIAVDDVIIGGGAAGLSLACELANQQSGRSLRILEPREDYQRDRTWCFWRLAPSRLDHLVTHRWHKWSVGYGGQRSSCYSSRYPYCHIPADRFYAWSVAQLAKAKAKGSTLQMATSVSGLRETSQGVIVQSSSGDFLAQRVFDSRPPQSEATQASHVELKQHFCGWHVRSEVPLFNAEQVTLMDFVPREDRQIQFWYLLPFSSTEALVEATFISSAVMPRAKYQAEISRYLAQIGAAGRYQVTWQEQGCLPMSTRQPVKSTASRIMPIGSAAGLIKPSTGYAMWAIQRHTRQLISALTISAPTNGRTAALRARARGLSVLDAIFLSVLQRYPKLAPELFYTLFSQVQSEALVRFLNDEPSARDVLSVMSAMPKGLFLRQACMSAPVWLRY